MEKPDLLDVFWGSSACEHHDEMHKLIIAMLTNANPLPIQSAMKSVLCEWVEMKLGGKYTIISNDRKIQVQKDGIWLRNFGWKNAHMLLELLNENS